MVFLVKILRTGLGLASEAIHAARDQPSPKVQPHVMESLRENLEHPVSPVQALTNSSWASEESKHDVGRRQENEPDVGLDPPSHNVADVDQDEVAWQLDEMIERLKQPSSNDDLYSLPHDNASTYLCDERAGEEEKKLKQREALARELVFMAGPLSKKSQRLPCPVIIPQRRPRDKGRGFVRAYAPVLEDSGISQEVFLQFLEYLDIVNHVGANGPALHLQYTDSYIGLCLDRSSFHRGSDHIIYPIPSSHGCRNGSLSYRRHGS